MNWLNSVEGLIVLRGIPAALAAVLGTIYLAVLAALWLSGVSLLANASPRAIIWLVLSPRPRTLSLKR